MRYEKGHKEQTRKRVLDVAARQFRANGIEGTGVACLMADAGLTHGGFYAHFKSKDDLVREALSASHDNSRNTWLKEAQTARENGEDVLTAILRFYLRPLHRDRPDAGCSMAALAPEVARNDPTIRDVMASGAEALTAIIAAELPPALPEKKRRERAYAIFGLMMGTLQLARVATDPEISEAILQSGQEAALKLARDERET
ncbi:MAG: TetR/AcrR family transcriptional regulator [Microvirga sp.]